MELMRRTLTALEATRRLRAALAEGDLVRCAALLRERETALAAFADMHRAADEPTREACRPAIAELVEADEELRANADRALDAAAADWDRAPSAADARATVTSGLDRRA